jgi:hypothetical protein
MTRVKFSNDQINAVNLEFEFQIEKSIGQFYCFEDFIILRFQRL